MSQCNSETCEIPKSASKTKSSDFIPQLPVLKGLKLFELPGKKEIESESLWQEGGCLIYLVRRPGCVLCRNKAKELMGIREQLRGKGYGMAAVVHEELGVEEFREQYWPSDPIYLNSDLSLFAAINDDRKIRKQGLLSGLVSTDMWKRIRQAHSAGVEGNLKGEGRILGGILVVGPGDAGVKWVRTEKSFGDHASNEEILSVL